MPPHRIQVYDIGDSGTISPGSLFTIDKNYKYSIIQPAQKVIAGMFNKVIRLDFKIKDKQLQYKPLDIGEEENNAEIKKTIASAHEKYYSMGAMTADEIRSDLKLEKFENMDVDDDVKEWARTPKPIYLLRQAQISPDGQEVSTNVAGQGVSETANDFDDKSKEETGHTLDDKQVDSLMMKRFVSIISDIDDIRKDVSDLKEKTEVLIDETERGDKI
jgi:hypothetical protein